MPGAGGEDPRGVLAAEGAPLGPGVAVPPAEEGVPSPRSARYHEVRRLHQNGDGLRTIATLLGMSRNTVRAYVRASAPPDPGAHAPRRSKLDRYKPYLHQRWAEGCHNGALLLRELRRQGYRGGRSIVVAYLTDLRRATGEGRRSGPRAVRPLSPRQLAQLVLRVPETLAAHDAALVACACAASAPIATAVTSARAFMTLLRERRGDDLDAWIDRAEQSGITSVRGFATGLRDDLDAVRAGLILPFSNGPTEGHVNRLKLIKRQMYGRGKHDLLRQRVLRAG